MAKTNPTQHLSNMEHVIHYIRSLQLWFEVDGWKKFKLCASIALPRQQQQDYLFDTILATCYYSIICYSAGILCQSICSANFIQYILTLTWSIVAIITFNQLIRWILFDGKKEPNKNNNAHCWKFSIFCY